MANIRSKLHMERGLVWLSRYVSPSLLAASGVLIITIIALFVPPYIGMADNGDYFRILYSNGLYFNTPDYDSQYFGYFIKKFGIFQYFNENQASLFSSQSLFIKFSIWLNTFVDQQVFDVRVQAVLFTVLYIVAVYLLVESLTWKVPVKYGYPIAILAIFLFADTAYTAYFNSFFGESIVFIMMVYVFAAGLLMYRKRYNDYVLMAILLVSGLLLTTSKQQNAPLGIIIALMGVGLIFIRKERTFRVCMASSLAVLLLAGIGTYALIPKEFVNINKYHAMTRGILMGSEDPEDTLSKFEIDKQYAILNESIYYELYTTIDVDSPILEDHFYNKYGFGSILKYYVTHPGKAIDMLDLAAKSAFKIRPPAMGNYEKSVGKAFREQTNFFSGYSTLKAAMAPKTFGFVVIWMILILGLYMPAFIAAVKAKNSRRMLRLPLIVTMVLMGLSGIAVSIIGAGDADLSKHEFVFTAAFDIVTFVVVADAIRRRLWSGQELDSP
ncbi:hypothetical protein MH117_12555 [Paenibacillus sp. ACRRX]|uniref:glycan biosynthesis hexose transferase WsfD n=1 Tax=unclassified Paenibacillus TaxID=185978 RepID=UPI001EF63988|nr:MULTISPECIES: hypothetical protein [unclassified Paenibacillus]MCG7408255.1 hypothetical protein [Paenibacillus sp. ACRRX]MDK8181360.1 hypothetical protein [Paenibacillus sp. UMB4589-SE434]